MTFEEIKLDYANKTQTKISELTAVIEAQFSLGNESPEELEAVIELIDFHESLFSCPKNKWSEEDVLYWIEHFKTKYALFDVEWVDEDLYSLPIAVPGGNPGVGDWATNSALELVRSELAATDTELTERILALEQFDYSDLIPESLTSDVAYSKNKVDEHTTAISGVNTQLTSIVTNLNEHIVELTKHIQAGERSAWNAKVSPQQLTSAISNLAEALHSHQMGDIDGLQDTLNNLQTQITNLPAPEAGQDGITPNITVGSVTEGETFSVSLAPESTLQNPILNFVLVKGEKGDAFIIDKVDNLANKHFYDNEETGYAYLAQDTGDLYILISAGNWSLPIPFKGHNGWTPRLGLYEYNADTVILEIPGFFGGSGPTPQLVGPIGDSNPRFFLGAGGYTTIPQNAINVKGRRGNDGAEGKPFMIDQQGTDRSLYNSETKGFTFYNTANGKVSFKLSATEGDWSLEFQWKGEAASALPVAKNTFYAGPIGGSTAIPAFRAIVAEDIPFAYKSTGNAFGSDAVIGLTDNFSLIVQTANASLLMKVNGVNRFTLSPNGKTTISGDYIGEALASEGLVFSGSFTAQNTSSASMAGYVFRPTIVASNSNQLLTAMVINPTYTVGGFAPNVIYLSANITGVASSDFSLGSKADGTQMGINFGLNGGGAPLQFSVGGSFMRLNVGGPTATVMHITNASVNITNSPSAGTYRLQVKGNGTTTGGLFHLKDDADSPRLSILDNGTFIYNTSSASQTASWTTGGFSISPAASITSATFFNMTNTFSYTVNGGSFARISPRLSYSGANGGTGLDITASTTDTLTQLTGTGTVNLARIMMGQSTATAYNGNFNFLTITSVPAAGVNINSGIFTIRNILINPAYDFGGTVAAGSTVYGIDYVPTFTGSQVNVVAHYAARFAVGGVLIGGAGLGTATHITNTGILTGNSTLSLGASQSIRFVINGPNGQVEIGNAITANGFTFNISSNNANSSGGGILNLNTPIGHGGPLASTVFYGLFSSGNILSNWVNGATFYGARFSNTFAPTATSSQYVGVQVSPVLNITGSASGKVIAFDYNPSVTNIIPGVAHIAYRATAGRSILGAASDPTARLHIVGEGTSNGEILRLTNATPTGVMLILDNGLIHFGNLSVLANAVSLGTSSGGAAETNDGFAFVFRTRFNNNNQNHFHFNLVGGGSQQATSGGGLLNLVNTFSASAGSPSYTHVVSKPTYSISGTGTVVVTGYEYDPVINLSGSGEITSHIAFRSTIGRHIYTQNNVLQASESHGILLNNTTASVSGVLNQQYSPAIVFEGTGWKTAATAGSQSVRMAMFLQTVEGVNAPSARLQFRRSINNGAYTDFFSVSSSGGIILPPADNIVTFDDNGNPTTRVLFQPSGQQNQSANQFNFLGVNATLNLTGTASVTHYASLSVVNVTTSGTVRSFASLPNITAAVNVVGFEHNPVNPGNISGNNIAFRAVSGRTMLGSANNPSARLQVVGAGTTTGELVRFDDSGSANRFLMLDNGTATFATGPVRVGGFTPGSGVTAKILTDGEVRSTVGYSLIPATSAGNAKTGMYATGISSMDFWTSDQLMFTLTLVGNSTGIIANIRNTFNSNSGGTTGIGSALGITTQLVPTAGTVNYKYVYINPVVNPNTSSGTWAGDVYAFHYDPQLTSTSGITAHYGVIISPAACLNGFGLVAALPTATIDIAGSVGGRASLRIRPGDAVTAPNDGEVWLDSATDTLHIRINGVTKTFTLT